MNQKSELIRNYRSITGDIISWLFGLLVLAIGLVNMFWGNDQAYGVFIFLLAFLYFPPVTALFKRITGLSIPLFIKVLVALFIIWSAMGVGELPAKIDLMLEDLG